MEREQVEQRIQRIIRMEMIFDELQKALAAGSEIQGNILKELMQYYESEQWKKDYESDERGELPAALKRGVLSEDGVYSLLCEIEKLQKKD